MVLAKCSRATTPSVRHRRMGSPDAQKASRPQKSENAGRVKKKCYLYVARWWKGHCRPRYWVYYSSMSNNPYSSMSNNPYDEYDSNREEALERRVAELEAAVSRLERELRTKRLSDLPTIDKGLDYVREATKAMNIGALAGTLRSHGSRNIDQIGESAVLPSEPYKAD